MGTDAYKIAPHQLPAPRFHEKIQFPAQEQKDLIAVMAVKIRGLNGGKLDVFILTGKILVQMQKYFFLRRVHGSYLPFCRRRRHSIPAETRGFLSAFLLPFYIISGPAARGKGFRFAGESERKVSSCKVLVFYCIGYDPDL